MAGNSPLVYGEGWSGVCSVEAAMWSGAGSGRCVDGRGHGGCRPAE